MDAPDRDELPKYLEQEAVARILAAAARRSQRDLAALLTTYKLGLRASELVRLDRSSWRPDTRRMRIVRSKGSRSGEMPITQDLAQLLGSYLASRSDKHASLIVGRRGRLSTRQLERIFEAAATTAGVELHDGQSVHCLRHSVAVHLLDAGRDIREVQDWLGHRSVTSTDARVVQWMPPPP
jgi:integrase/recombinase XerD